MKPLPPESHLKTLTTGEGRRHADMFIQASLLTSVTADASMLHFTNTDELFNLPALRVGMGHWISVLV